MEIHTIPEFTSALKTKDINMLTNIINDSKDLVSKEGNELARLCLTNGIYDRNILAALLNHVNHRFIYDCLEGYIKGSISEKGYRLYSKLVVKTFNTLPGDIRTYLGKIAIAEIEYKGTTFLFDEFLNKRHCQLIMKIDVNNIDSAVADYLFHRLCEVNMSYRIANIPLLYSTVIDLKRKAGIEDNTKLNEFLIDGKMLYNINDFGYVGGNILWDAIFERNHELLKLIISSYAKYSFYPVRFFVSEENSKRLSSITDKDVIKYINKLIRKRGVDNRSAEYIANSDNYKLIQILIEEGYSDIMLASEGLSKKTRSFITNNKECNTGIPKDAVVRLLNHIKFNEFRQALNIVSKYPDIIYQDDVHTSIFESFEDGEYVPYGVLELRERIRRPVRETSFDTAYDM